MKPCSHRWPFLMALTAACLQQCVAQAPIVDLTFDPPFGRWPGITAVSVQKDGKILVAGSALYQDGRQISILRLQPDGALDSSFRSQLSGPVSELIQAPNSRSLVVLHGTNALEVPLFRIDANGTIDPGFAPDPAMASLFGASELAAAFAQPGGEIILLGRGRIRRLNTDGSADVPFNAKVAQFDDSIGQVGVHSSGEILLESKRSLIRLSPDGPRDTSFLSRELWVHQFLILADKRILVWSWAGLNIADERSFLRLQPDGTIDDSFGRPSVPEPWARGLLAEINGNVYFGDSQSRVFKISSDGIVDSDFQCGWHDYIGCFGWFQEGSLQGPDGAVPHRGALLCWSRLFSKVNGATRPLARIIVDNPARTVFAFQGNGDAAYSAPLVVAGKQKSLSVWVLRLGDSSTIGTVDYQKMDSSAEVRTNFISTSGTLSFASGEKAKALLISLPNDGELRRIRQFTLTLSNPFPTASLGPPLTVRVEDEEFGLAPSAALRDVDGSVRLEYNLTGATLGADFVLERSADLEHWTAVPGKKLGDIGDDCFRSARFRPNYIPISTNTARSFFRAVRK